MITLIPVAHVGVFGRQVMLMHAVVLGVHLPLLRVGRAHHALVTVFAAPAGQKALTGIRRSLKVHHEVRVVAEFARAIGVGERGQFKPACQLDNHFLKWPALARGRQYRHTYRIHRAAEF